MKKNVSKLHKISVKGEFHLNNNEDCTFHAECGQNQVLLALMDGCSSGIDSHFASQLIAKILKKIAHEETYLSFAQNMHKSNKDLLNDISKKLFKQLVEIQQLLQLSKYELLSTVMLVIANTEKQTAELLIAGDGLVCIDGKFIEFENDNVPNYPAYHLHSDFQFWFENQTIRKSIPSFKDISISTDGIFTFSAFDQLSYPHISEKQIMHALFKEYPTDENHNILHKTLVNIEKTFGLKPNDDLSIIRLIT